VTIVLFLWGRWRHDLIALASLLACVVTGLVPATEAFSGFGHPAVITVACVLILSQGLRNTGTVDVLAQRVMPTTDSPTLSITALMLLGAVLSAFMNNVGAMALLMPIAIKTAARHEIPPGKMLMPLAFATILGGMTTLIGTPPNLIVSGFRAEMGTSFNMFDFSPVGIGVAVTCLVFLSLIGWRLVPARVQSDSGSFDTGTYLTEVHVPADSKTIGMTIRSVQEKLEGADAQVVGMARNEFRVMAPVSNRKVRENDVLIIEAEPESLAAVLSSLDIRMEEPEQPEDPEQASDEKVAGESSDQKDSEEDDESAEESKKSNHYDEILLAEMVAMPDSLLIGRSSEDLSLGAGHGLNLLAISRQGRRSIKRLRSTPIMAGDVMLLQGAPEAIAAFSTEFSAVPLAERSVTIPDRGRASLATIVMGVAIAGAAFGLLPAAVSFAAGVVCYAVFRIVKPRNLYDAVDWPVIVLLGALLPVAGAMSSTGAADLLANGLLNLVAQNNPVIALALVLVITMTLSDFMNNAATAAVMCPIAIGIAFQVDASPDSFLMAVAIG
ncbi:MAG: SLC13 family permease, partial [Pseudomonadales bacterium]